MKITRYQDRLILHDTPTGAWLTGWSVFALGLLSLVFGLCSGSNFTNSLILFFVGVVGILMGFFILRRAYEIINTFSADKLDIEHKALRGHPRLVASYPLAEIEGVEMGKEIGEGTEYYIFLRLRSGKNVPLLAKYSGSEEKTYQAAKAIRDFLILYKKAE